MKKKMICVLLLCMVSLGSLTACGGDSSDSPSAESTEDSKDMLGTYMTVVQAIVEQKLSDVEYSYNTDDWTYLEHDDGTDTVTVTTKVTLKDSSEKQVLTAIFTFADNSYKGHYLKIGSDVLLDDGTIK